MPDPNRSFRFGVVELRRPFRFAPLQLSGTVEGHDLSDPAPSAAGQMAKVSRLQRRMPRHALAGQQHIRLFQWPHLNVSAGDQLQRRVQGVRPPHPQIYMHQFLDNLR